MDDRLVQDEVRLGKASLDVSEAPFRCRLALGKPILSCFGKIGLRPLERRHLAVDGSITLRAAVGPVGPEAVQWVQDERQRLEVDPDLLDGVCRGGLVHGGERQNRFALVTRLHGEGRLCGGLWGRHLVGGQDAQDPVHRQCLAGIDSKNPGMGHGAGKELGEDHSFRAEVLGVSCPPRYLGHEVLGDDVLSDQLLRHDRLP